MVDSVAAFLGWNSSIQGWGAGTWNTNVAFSLTATGSVGTVVVNAASVVPVTGLAATGSVGSISVVVDASINATGLAATGAPGAVTVTGTALFDVTGVAGTGQVGDVAALIDVAIDVTGLSATGQVGEVLVWGRIVPNQIPEYSGTTPLQTPGYTNIAA
jgi:hypothetical protein